MEQTTELEMIDTLLDSMDGDEVEYKLETLRYHIDFIKQNKISFDLFIFDKMLRLERVFSAALGIIRVYEQQMSAKTKEISNSSMQIGKRICEHDTERTRTNLSLVRS